MNIILIKNLWNMAQNVLLKKFMVMWNFLMNVTVYLFTHEEQVDVYTSTC